MTNSIFESPEEHANSDLAACTQSFLARQKNHIKSKEAKILEMLAEEQSEIGKPKINEVIHILC